MAKLDSPSAQRNKDPIWNILSSKAFPKLLPKDEGPLKVLEIAAGCGVHCHHFASKLVETSPTQEFLWYPSDPEESSRASIEAYLQESPTLQGKLQPPVDLSLGEKGAIIVASNNSNNPFLNDNTGTLDLILCINMIHISPWTATLGLMQVAGKHLKEGGILYTYGPYKVNGEAVESNLSFDANLKSRDPSWGVRNLEDVIAAAEKIGLEHKETVEMPANNLSVLFQKKKST